MIRGLVLLLSVLVFACSSSPQESADGCDRCHRPADSVDGLEEQHPLFAIECVDCHGGNAGGVSVTEAHVPNPLHGMSIRGLSKAELDAIDPNYRRFVNPTDVVAAQTTCGDADCHPDVVAQSASSLHANATGLVDISEFTAGVQPMRDAMLDIRERQVPALPQPLTAASADAAIRHALVKDCSGCHLGLYGSKGQGRANGDFAGGCAACHMFYDDDGLSRSADPARDKTGTPHPVKHIIELSIPDRQCERCHSRSLRVATQYRGYSKDADPNLPDDTPRDIHQAKGLGCVDCHLAPDGHGDGTRHTSMAGEVGIECQDCHGTFDAAIAPGDGGVFRTSSGVELKRMRRDGEMIVLKGALDGKDHPVTQLPALRPSQALDKAHKTENHRELECYACHTSWMQNLYLVRRTIDQRAQTKNPIDGAESAAIVEVDEIQSTGDLFIGINSEGKIGTFMLENDVYDVVAPCNPAEEPPGTCVNSAAQPIFGKKIVDGYVPRTSEQRRGFSWTPVFAHTTADRTTVQACSRCHPRQFELSDVRVKTTFGFGTGEARFAFLDTRTSTTIDLSQTVNAVGEPLTAMGVSGSRPVPNARIQRAMTYIVEPGLR